MRKVPEAALLQRRWIQRLAYNAEEEQRIAYACATVDRNYVCDEHFDDDAYTTSERLVLKHGAVPRDYVSPLTSKWSEGEVGDRLAKWIFGFSTSRNPDLEVF